MVVGDNKAVITDHKARAQRLGSLRGIAALTVGAAIRAHEILEEILERRSRRHHRHPAGAGSHHRSGGDINNRRADLFGQIGKAFRRTARLDP